MVLRTAFDQARCEALESFSSVVSVFSLLLRVEKLACLITNVARPRTCATTPFSPSALQPSGHDQARFIALVWLRPTAALRSSAFICG